MFPIKALWTTLAVVVAMLLVASLSLALTQEEIDRENERFKALSQETDRLMGGGKSYQLDIKSPYARKSALRKLRKAEANYQEMIAINRRLRSDAQTKNFPPRVKMELDRSYAQIEKALRELQNSIKFLMRFGEKKR